CDLVQRAGGIGVAVRLLGGVEQCAYLVVVVPDVDVHTRGENPVAQPEGEELPGAHVSTDDHVVLGGAAAHILHAQVVLVGEEVGVPVVDVAAPGQHAAGALTLAGGVVPV